MIGHSLRRTSPKGQDFIGTCTLCGTPNLPMAAVQEECPNQRGLTQEEAVIEAVTGMPLIDRMALAMVRKTAEIYGDPMPTKPDLTFTRKLAMAAIGELPDELAKQIGVIDSLAGMGTKDERSTAHDT